jgi:hypothetical protein
MAIDTREKMESLNTSWEKCRAVGVDRLSSCVAPEVEVGQDILIRVLENIVDYL